MKNSPIHVVVVDDMAIYRRIVGDALASHPNIEVVGTAANGRIALERIAQLQPDLVTLDIEMPEMDGLEVLRQLNHQKSDVGVIMLSALTSEGAEATLEALKLGALDFVLKPTGSSREENMEVLRKRLCGKIMGLGNMLQVRHLLRGVRPSASPPERETGPATQDVTACMRRLQAAGGGRPKLVALGISTGGPQALTRMLPKLPSDLAAPLLIVQHMPPVFTKSLADDLDRRCQLTVQEAQDGQVALPGYALIAPGGKQMQVEAQFGRLTIRLRDDPPENSCRPSVDYLFRSVAGALGRDTLGVIMTGMGEDGAEGCRLIKQAGGGVIAQDEASCVVFGMPRKPVGEGIADAVVPLDGIAAEMIARIGQRVAACT